MYVCMAKIEKNKSILALHLEGENKARLWQSLGVILTIQHNNQKFVKSPGIDTFSSLINTIISNIISN